MKYQYHVDGSSPQDANTIFVFGSNLSGIHGAGAARAAFDRFGAIWGQGTGFAGRTYAIPTKDFGISRTLNEEEISEHIVKFITAANVCNHLTFFVTRIGCGLAGYDDSEIAPLFKGCPSNCNFPEQWKQFLE